VTQFKKNCPQSRPHYFRSYLIIAQHKAPEEFPLPALYVFQTCQKSVF